ncbi:mannosyltransferase putative-domain-containing protein [Obelidium mucronatum]|nr:mannosyltransferase putative-domain-containing protein [Obelidium mucronatum]
MGRIGRANLIAYTILYDKTSIIPFLESSYDSGLDLEAQLYVLVQDLTSVLYPWMSPTFNSIKEMQSRYSMAKSDGMVREGIIFTTGKWHFELTLHAIVTLRRVINCSLPIEVHYGGPEDLSPDMIDTFNALPNTVAVDTVSNFFTSETSQFGGWSLKPFALLASSFTRVIFIDADALFFQDPQTLLHSFTFQKHGQVFFHDRSLFRDDPVTWFREINPQYSHYASTLRYMNGLSWHEMESGVVVIDKSISGNLHALLMICNMNSKEERDAVTYKKMHGDKETYWISFDILRVPYAFVPTFGGTVGYKNETTGGICGGLFHTDENMKPLWWNGGVVANKWHSKDSTFMKFEYAAFDTDGDKIKWVWETPKTPFCLTPRYKWEVIELGSREKTFGNKFVEIYKDMQSTGWKSYLKERMNVNVD